MKLIDPSYKILCIANGADDEYGPLEFIEKAGRTCYKSNDEFKSKERTEQFIKMLIKRGHESVLEHSFMSVKFICDRGVSHEIVRHRLASFSQESTRYCNYAGGTFNKELTFIIPSFTVNDSQGYRYWKDAMYNAEQTYLWMISHGYKPEEARTVLPNSIKTELVMSANFREWRHFFKLRAARASGKAHPQMEELVRPLLKEVKTLVPVIFDDIEIPTD